MERNTKEIILNTAAELFARDGMTSVNAIIAEAGLSKGVFFHHFQSKQDLILQLAEREFKERVAKVKKCAASLPNGPGRMLKAYVKSWEDEVVLSGNVQLSMFNILADDELRALVVTQYKHVRDMLWDPALPDTLISVVMNACVGSLLRFILADKSPAEIVVDRRELAAELFRIIDRAVECGVAETAPGTTPAPLRKTGELG